MRTNAAWLGVIAVLSTAGCTDGRRDRLEASVGDSGGRITVAIDGFQKDVRETTNELAETIADLDSRYASAVDESAAQWALTKAEISEARYQLEEDLAAMRVASGVRATELRADVAQDLEVLTALVERARLRAIDSGQDFVAESEERLGRVDREIAALRRDLAGLEQGRSEAGRTVDALEEEARALRARLERVNGEAERDALTDAIADLTATVRRKLVELRHELAS